MCDLLLNNNNWHVRYVAHANQFACVPACARAIARVSRHCLYKYKSTERNVHLWPLTFFQTCTGNFWYIHKPTCLLN